MATRPFRFVARAVQEAYYADAVTGQIGFGPFTRPGDVIHDSANAVESPPIPFDRNGYTLGSVLTGFTFPDLTGYRFVYWDAEYNPGAGHTPAECYAAGVYIRAQLDAWNTAHGTNVLLFAYFHTPNLDYIPLGGAAGDVAALVDGATVGISQWQDPSVWPFDFIAHAGGTSGGFTDGYVGLLKEKTRLHQGGIRLVIFFKDEVHDRDDVLTADQLLAQVQVALAPVAEGGLAVDIWESYYGNPITPHNYHLPMSGALRWCRSAMTTLLQIRQTAAKQLGTFQAGTITSATTAVVVCTSWPVLSATLSEGTWEDAHLLLPSAIAANKVRLVDTYTPSTGTLTVDAAYTIAPTVGWAFELHGGPLEPQTEFLDVINTVLKSLLVEVEITFTPSATNRRQELTTANSWLTDGRWVRQAGYLSSTETRDVVDPFRTHPVYGETYADGALVYFDYGHVRWAGTETVYLRCVKPVYFHCRALLGDFGTQSGLALETDEAPVNDLWVAAGVLVEAYDRYARILEGAAGQSLVRDRDQADKWLDALTAENFSEPDDTLTPPLWWGPLPSGRGGVRGRWF